jgi:hypothetical protein
MIESWPIPRLKELYHRLLGQPISVFQSGDGNFFPRQIFWRHDFYRIIPYPCIPSTIRSVSDCFLMSPLPCPLEWYLTVARETSFQMLYISLLFSLSTHVCLPLCEVGFPISLCTLSSPSSRSSKNIYLISCIFQHFILSSYQFYAIILWRIWPLLTWKPE